MKYLWVNNFSIFFKDKVRVIISFYTITLFMFIGNTYLNPVYNQSYMLDVLGLHLSFKYGVLAVLIGVFNIGFFLFIVFSLFNLDNHYITDGVFLRMKMRKWSLLELLNLLILDFLFLGIIYIFLFLVCSIKIGMISNFSFLSYFYIQYLFLLFIQLISLLFYLSFYKFSKITIVLCIVIICLFFKIPYTYEFLTKYDKLIIFFDMFLFGSNYVFMIRNKELLFSKLKGSV